MKEDQKYPDHPDRFCRNIQVLSRESLTGRCYWEVEWCGRSEAHIAVTERKERSDDYQFGSTLDSWCLDCKKNIHSVQFNSVESQVSGPVLFRIGVYLDHSAGVLAFYNVSEGNMSLLHRVQATFTKPLYAGVSKDETRRAKLYLTRRETRRDVLRRVCEREKGLSGGSGETLIH
ncbi:hypothetical protein WMY93_032162 [Mugilogobius chulae]|uniref:B30.2/SPRY domain-containing protein n=1 Tax=Mugilogobius chulae TaxID=88201 RepID=A0AAW0MEK7_9GOBI